MSKKKSKCFIKLATSQLSLPTEQTTRKKWEWVGGGGGGEIRLKSVGKVLLGSDEFTDVLK